MTTTKQGRPKRSRDIDCVCRTCQKNYTVPDWRHDGREFCSRTCYYAFRRGSGRFMYAEQRENTCRMCGVRFPVGRQGQKASSAVFCSPECHERGRRIPRQSPPREMTTVEAAWLAGIFDGEGNIAFTRPDDARAVRLSVAQCHRGLLERVAEVAGTGSLALHSKATDKHREGWVWRCYASNARGVLRQIRPWLIVKAAEADRALGITFTLDLTD